MKYWWVNHKATFKHEHEGQYIWSPQTNSNGSRNQTYLNLTQVQAGDVIFSYAGGSIKLIGIAESRFRIRPKPVEFGVAGKNWGSEGFFIDVNWIKLARPIKPKDYIVSIGDLLPEKNSPIQRNGNGNQSVYLADISDELGDTLLGITEESNRAITSLVYQERSEVLEKEKAEQILNDETIPERRRLQLIKARTGQGLYRRRLLEIETKCRLTGVTDVRFLIASHIKPWRDSNNKEKIDGNNGLLLSPHIDKLFDKGLISFTRNGDILYVNDEIRNISVMWNLQARNLGKLNSAQRLYMEYHRDVVFVKMAMPTRVMPDEIDHKNFIDRLVL